MTEFTEDRESLNIAEYLWLLRRGKWIILAFVVVSVAFSIYLTVRTTPIYRSSATFIYMVSSSMSRTLEMPGIYWFEIDTAKNNQIQIINSRSMAEAIADSILRSPEPDSLIYLLYDGYPPSGPGLRGSLVGLARGSISVAIMKDTDFFVLSAVGLSPEASALLANLAVQTYYRRNLLDARGENREIREFLDSQLLLIEAQLTAAEDALMSFKQVNGYVDLDAETRNLISSLSSIESRAEEAGSNADALSASRDYLTVQLETYRAHFAVDLENLTSDYVSQLQSDIAFYESARATLYSSGTGDDEPALVTLERDLETKKIELARAIENLASVQYPSGPILAVDRLVSQISTVEADLRAERTRETVLRMLVYDMEAGLSTLPEAERNLARLERNVLVTENLYYLLRNRFEEIRIAEAGQIGNVTIVDSALPGGLIKPSRKKNLVMGLLIGLALGIAVVFLREQIDTTIKNPEAVESLGIPVLAVLPRLQRSELPKATDGGYGLITCTSPRSPGSEAYRDLRTSLRFSSTDVPIRTLLITSAGPREGKSTIASNLAVVLAQSGQKVLLVDTDLRRPVVHKLFHVPREPGFSEHIAGLATLDEVLRETDVENLNVLTCGFIPHNPSELVGSQKVKKFIEDITTKFDKVIFDSPPVAVVTDAILLSSNIDATLVVVGAKLADRKVLESTWSKLKRTSGSMPGAVLNGFDPIRMYTSYGYYTYRYHYYYSEGTKIRKKIPALRRKKHTR
jgi:capsular exopolysaccharide synthesis family protein